MLFMQHKTAFKVKLLKISLIFTVNNVAYLIIKIKKNKLVSLFRLQTVNLNVNVLKSLFYTKNQFRSNLLYADLWAQTVNRVIKLPINLIKVKLILGFKIYSFPQTKGDLESGAF